MDTQQTPIDQSGTPNEEGASPAAEGEPKILIITDEEKQVMLVNDASAVKEEPDLEAQVDNVGTPKASPGAPPVSRVPKTYEERRKLRVTSMDNLRTTVIALLIIQNALIVAISTHPDSARLHEIAPKSFMAATIFISIGRVLLVPMLFFLSGFSSRFAMVLHSKSIFWHFIGKRTGRAIWMFAMLQILVLPWTGSNGIFNGKGPDVQVPYYASKAGRDALLNGPAYYVLLILILDYIYIFCYFCNAIIYGDRRGKHFINSPKRLQYVRGAVSALVQCYIMFHREIGLNHLPERWRNLIYATNSAELHFPILYLVAYLAGIQFVSYCKFIVRATGIARRYLFVLIVRFGISILLLGLLIHYFPDTIGSYLDIRNQPQMAIQSNSLDKSSAVCAPVYYGSWAAYTIFCIHDALIAAFFNVRMLKRPWGRFLRYSFLQIIAQLTVYLLWMQDFQPAYINNVLVRGSIMAGVSLVAAYSYSASTDAVSNAFQSYFKPAVRLDGEEAQL